MINRSGNSHNAQNAVCPVSGTDEDHVYRSDNNGATFISVSGNIPRGLPVNAIEIDPNDNSHLFVGTDAGAFVSLNGNDLFQLAVNKAGTIRGNYYNVLSDTTLPVYGSVDKQTQRAAWTVGDRKEPIYEAGFANLTKSETTMLVHFGKDRTQQWTLIRMDPPAEKK